MALAALLAGTVAAGATPAVDLTVTHDMLWNTRGGITQEHRRITNAQMIVRHDFGGAPGAATNTVFANVLANTGAQFSTDVTGDAQVASNIEAYDTLRFLELYWQRRAGPGDRLSVLFGLWDLNSEIDVIEPAALFVNSSHGIGFDFSQSGENGPSIFPETSVSLFAKYRFESGAVLRSAILDATPGNFRNSEVAELFQSNDDGLLFVTEWQQPVAGLIAKAGAWGYTEKFDRLDAAGKSTGYGLYGSVYGRHGNTSGFLRVGMASEEVHPGRAYLGAGLIRHDVFPALPGSDAGIAAARVETSEALREGGARTHETNIEVTIDLPLRDWLRLQPNVQYIANPGFSPALDDALVVGLRAELAIAF